MFKTDDDGDIVFKKFKDLEGNDAVYHFIDHESKLICVPEFPIPEYTKLKPGAYKFFLNDYGPDWFEPVTMKTDKMIDLPSSAYDRIVSEMDNFTTSECKSRFEKYGYLYKRSTLLEGPHGSGKSVIINRVCQDVIDKGGIVLVDPAPRALEEAFKQIDRVQPETFIVVVFEEFDKHFEGAGGKAILGGSSNVDSKILQVLDGHVQRNNVMYLCATNYLNKIPKRVLRPGRISSVIHVPYPESAARAAYLSDKLNSESEIELWVEKTAGLSIDELSECVKSVKCLGYNLDDQVARIKETKSKGL